MERRTKRSQGRSFILKNRLFVVVDSKGRVVIPKNDLPIDYLNYGYHIYMQNERLCISLDRNINEKMLYIRLMIPHRIRKAYDIKENTIFECKRSTEFEGFVLERVEEDDLIGG